MDISSLLEVIAPYSYNHEKTGWMNGDNKYLLFTITFCVAVFVFEKYLDNRQLAKFIGARGNDVPKELKDAKIDETQFEKSIHYGVDKLGFGMFESTFVFFENMVTLLLGFSPLIWDTATYNSHYYGVVDENSSMVYKEIVQSLLFLGMVTLFNEVLYFGFGLYSTFVIEERHGFNKTTYLTYFSDKLKNTLLMFGIGGPVLSAMIWIIISCGEYFYFYLWLFMFVFSLLFMTIWPEYIAPLYNKYTPIEDGPTFDSIKALTDSVQFPLTKLFEVDGSTRSAHSNAYFYGFFKNKRIVIFDTLKDQVDTEELLAILGHEIGHWKLWHSIQGFIVSQVHMFLMFYTYSLIRHTPGLFSAFGYYFDGKEPVLVSLMLFSQVFWGPFEKFVMFCMNINSRRNEFQADKYACDLGMGAKLGTGLIKISVENKGAATMLPDRFYSMYHFSHPPLVERLMAINEATGRGSKKRN